jgi:2-amino-4-hydroxy-6-hydroxymethyldihydropteridine diphosphokinase
VIAYVGLGSNVGDREAMLRMALEQLAALPSTALTKASSFYETEPVGVSDQPWFLNAVAELDTDLTPGQLMWNLQRVERALGRSRRERWGPRTIDLDLLLAGDLVIEEPGLVLPHPELLNRAFALVPLVEIDPLLVHPVTGETLLQHLARLGSGKTVHRASGEPQ